jgi:hypothetical protein
VDTAAIDSQVLAIELRDHPDLDGWAGRRLRPVHHPAGGGRQPPPRRLKDQLRELLIGLGDDPAARPTFDYELIDRFIPVGDAAANDLRAMLTTIRPPTGPASPSPRWAVEPYASGAVAAEVLGHQHLGVIEPDDLVLLGLDRRHDVAYPVTTARPFGPDGAFS